MSAFLGSIHHWLFNKVLIFEDLEAQLVEDLQKEFAEDIASIYAEVKQKYGHPFEKGVDLEKAIQHDNIHGWLQQRIEIAETRQAEFIAKVTATFDKKAKNVLLSTHKSHGERIGKKAKEKEEPKNAEELYQSLNNNILDGMPCDQVNNIVDVREEYLRWDVVSCLHRGYWESVGADIELFYSLRSAWVGAFIASANEKFEYKMQLKENKIINEITKE
ncbi:hypothetical protein PRVXH_002093 [Proteinivorax hydrogeniformans]|uniref:Uncharacterized protein n=1 Tax=Proteinivorax hydrogeniformans TaxID=1826727 RepID=A0AAU8HSL2_9FIRM